MNPLQSLLALAVFPGLLFALPMGWLMLGLARKLTARMQSRIGPPLSQPFFDFVKLAAKRPVPRAPAGSFLLTFLPLLALGSTLGALALLPVFPGQTGFAGDLILLVGLMEMAPLCAVLGGFASRSIYGQVGATREAILGIAGNVPFLAALIAMATVSGSLQVAQLAVATPWAVRGPAMLAILLCLPVKLRINPFSVSNAEQEILAGPFTEFDGPRLALWELAHALEWVLLVGFVVTLAVPARSPFWPLDAVVFALLSLLVVPLLILLATATGRLKITQATRFLWRWATLVSALAVFAALAWQHWRA